MEKTYKNTGYFMLLLIPVFLTGFYVTYFSHLTNFDNGFSAVTKGKITIFHHFHATLASIWILFLIAQPLLIRYRKFRIHQLVGKMTYFIFPLLILSLIILIVNILKSSHSPGAYNPIAGTVLLIIFYSLAVYNRKNTPKHMRYMIGTATTFLQPSIARIGVFIFGLKPKTSNNFLVFTFIYLILIGLILLDKKHGKDFKPYILILIAWVVNQFVFNIII